MFGPGFVPGPSGSGLGPLQLSQLCLMSSLQAAFSLVVIVIVLIVIVQFLDSIFVWLSFSNCNIPKETSVGPY